MDNEADFLGNFCDNVRKWFFRGLPFQRDSTSVKFPQCAEERVRHPSIAGRLDVNYRLKYKVENVIYLNGSSKLQVWNAK